MPSSRVLAFLSFAAVAACSGDDGGGPVTVIDAAVDAAPDAPIDAPACTGMVCNGGCVDTQTDEDFCGNCSTACTDGEACFSGDCMCPPAFVPESPSFLLNQIRTDIPQTQLGIGGYITTEIDVLIVAKPDAAPLNTPFPLTGATLGTPPFVAAGYDIDQATMEPTAAYYATAGTVTFTRQCQGGFAGVASNVTFSAVTGGFTSPMIVPNGCTFTVPTVNFAYGAVCPNP